MKQFPDSLNVSNIKCFKKIYYTRILNYLRKDIYDHLLKNIENDYFDLEVFFNRHFTSETNKDELSVKMRETIQMELKNLGWNSKTSYGGTALFIYSSDTPPKSCWEEGL